MTLKQAVVWQTDRQEGRRAGRQAGKQTLMLNIIKQWAIGEVQHIHNYNLTKKNLKKKIKKLPSTNCAFKV